MKKVFVIPAAIFAIVFLITAVRISKSPSNTDEQPSSQNYSTTSEPMYILKEHQGIAAVFTPNSPEPKRKLKDIVIESLPEYDKSLLKTGIKVYSEKELQRLIEDYDS